MLPATNDAIAAIASFVAGSVATLVVALFSPPLAEIALKFQPADYFSLMVFGLVGAVVLARALKDEDASRAVLDAVALGLLGQQGSPDGALASVRK